RPSKLWAANFRSGPSGSWKPLFADPVDAGTRVEVVERLEEADGRLFYRIVAPARARGYMLRTQVREATPQEVESHLKAARARPAEEIENREAAEYIARDASPVQNGTREEIEQAANEATGANTDVLGLNEPTTPTTDDADESLLEPIVPVDDDASDASTTLESGLRTNVPVVEQSSTPTTTPATTTPNTTGRADDVFRPAFRSPGSDAASATTTPGTTPNTGPATTPTATPGANPSVETIDQSSGTPVERPLLTPSELEIKFQQVFRQREEQAEYDELISEYRRTLAAMASDPASQRLRTQLERRLTWLEIKSDHRRVALEFQRASESEALAEQNVASKIRQLAQNRTYTVVGRLVPSTVYDGKRLPLMYRVMTVGPQAPRTIGYLRPDDASDLSAKVGYVVGILGEATLDNSLKLNIIRPDEVDILGATTLAGETADIDQ
ncbi:MAG: hypothetical protein KDA28_14365, partial [Phycisphaerales bacterium]|nr:hypothetical protein [Phycisphaerales bacterium]